MINNRLNLIADLKSFVQKSIEQHNIDHTVNRNDYFDLIARVNSLTNEDFESEEKYKYFLSYFNQMQKQADRHILEINFTENYLDIALFLWMTNFLSELANWLR